MKRLIFGLLLLALAPAAFAQVAPTTYGTFSNVPSIVTTTATSNVLSAPITVRQGRGLAIFPHFAGTNAGTANVIFRFAVSYDGTNWSTTTLNVTNAMSGTTAVRGFENLKPDVLANVRAIRLENINNAHTASVFITNVVWSISGQ